MLPNLKGGSVYRWRVAYQQVPLDPLRDPRLCAVTWKETVLPYFHVSAIKE